MLSALPPPQPVNFSLTPLMTKFATSRRRTTNDVAQSLSLVAPLSPIVHKLSTKSSTAHMFEGIPIMLVGANANIGAKTAPKVFEKVRERFFEGNSLGCCFLYLFLPKY